MSSNEPYADYDFGEAEDLNILNQDSLYRIIKYTSLALMFGSLLNIVSQYIYYGVGILPVLLFSSLLFFSGVIIQVVLRLNVGDRTKTAFFIAMLVILIPVVTFKFIEYASVTIWAFPFILILVSLVFIDRRMIIALAVSIFLTQIAVWVTAPQVRVLIEGSDHIVRIGLFAVAISIAFFVNAIYIKKIEQIASQMKKIKGLAYHDHLTELPNRMLFTAQLDHSIQQSQRTDKKLAVMFLDLDGFKMINDTMGHAVGDQILIDVAKRLAGTLRKSDVCARIGGDEFLVMIEQIEEDNAIELIGEKILLCFNAPFSIKNQDCFLTTSIGAAIYPTDGEAAETLIKNADIAMYQAKEKGKNQYVRCTPAMKTKVIETMKLSNSLYRALERNEFELYYQPQVDCASNRIVGMEALIRWHHPDLGTVLPGEFISIAEKTGLIMPIGQWVMRTACQQNKAWQDAGLPQIRMGVNVSVQEFQNTQIVQQVETILQETGLDPDYLELEITESVAMKEKTSIIDTLKALKAMGIHIAIDDFGTEYSSLNYLKQLPVDRIKIAMPFIQGIDISKEDEAITIAIIVLAKSMGLGVIAEGVETNKQLEFLSRRMCDELQGFYCYKPMPAQEIEALLKEMNLSMAI